MPVIVWIAFVDLIKNLPPERQEMILKEYIAIKMRQQADLGWDIVHEQLEDAAFCEEQTQIEARPIYYVTNRKGVILPKMQYLWTG